MTPQISQSFHVNAANPVLTPSLPAYVNVLSEQEAFSFWERGLVELISRSAPMHTGVCFS